MDCFCIVHCIMQSAMLNYIHTLYTCIYNVQCILNWLHVDINLIYIYGGDHIDRCCSVTYKLKMRHIEVHCIRIIKILIIIVMSLIHVGGLHSLISKKILKIGPKVRELPLALHLDLLFWPSISVYAHKQSGSLFK